MGNKKNILKILNPYTLYTLLLQNSNNQQYSLCISPRVLHASFTPPT
jgi:hypothetical protein